MADYTDGTAEGNILEFTTLSTKPVIKTLEASNITWNSATLNGRLESLGIYNQVNVYFLYKKTGETVWTATTPVTKTSPSDFSSSISGLVAETEYEFKVVASYGAGEKVEGEVIKFFTNPIPPPAVETLDATSELQPGQIKVTLKGNLIDLGGYSSVEGYFRYRKKGQEAWNQTSKDALSQTGYFTKTVTDLELNTTYQFEALADYDGKTVFGGISEFTTPSGEVEIETLPAEVISYKEAKLKGEIISLGIYGQVSPYFRYQKYGEGVWYETQKPDSPMTSPGVFSATLNNLESDTLYQFVALADYDGKTAQGYVLQFRTPKAEVSVKTLDATNITVELATLNGELTDFGDYTKANVYFRYRKVGQTSWLQTQKKEMTTLGNFYADISGLEINTEYEFRAMADYDTKTAEGEIKTFKTPTKGVKVQTNTATDVEVDSAILNGKITYLSGYPSVNAFFRYRKVGTETWTETPSQTLYGMESFSQPITGLIENVQYEFQALATYDGKTAYGDILNFKTLALVKINTKPATDISHFEATFNGEITSLGDFSETKVYFQFRKVGGAWRETSPKETKNTTGPFSFSQSNLSSNTNYEFKAMADYTNPITGRNYKTEGNILTFTTPKVPVTVETLVLDKNDYTGDTARLRGRVASLGDYPSAKVFFRYRQPGTPWYQTQKTEITSPVSFYADISSLSPNTQTEYQALAEYDGDLALGNILTFTTDPPEFRVETRKETNVTATSATLNGEVTSLGIYHQGKVYFKYKKSTDTSWLQTSKITLSQKQSFSINVSNLSPGVNYQFKAAADYDGKTWEGATLSFTTFNFSLSVSPGSATIIPGQSASATVTVTLTAGPTNSVSFSISGLPSGASASFSPTSCNPTCSSTMIISTSNTTPGGNYTITISATGGGITRTTNFALTVPSQLWILGCESGTLHSYSYSSYFSIGYRFVPQVKIRVYKLCGRWPRAGTRTVRLQDSAFNVLRSVNVYSSGSWRCADISPIDLNANKTYYVSEYGYGYYYQYPPGLPKTCNQVKIEASCYQYRASGGFTSPSCVTYYMYGQADIYFASW
jgi:hypothetical protein